MQEVRIKPRTKPCVILAKLDQAKHAGAAPLERLRFSETTFDEQITQATKELLQWACCCRRDGSTSTRSVTSFDLIRCTGPYSCIHAVVLAALLTGGGVERLYIHCQNNRHVDGAVMAALADGIAESPALKELWLQAAFSKDCTNNLARLLRSYATASLSLERLSLSASSIDGSVTSIANGLQEMRGLKKLDLSNCHLVDGRVAELVRSIPSSVECLSIAGNGCWRETASALASILVNKNCKLVMLDMGWVDKKSVAAIMYNTIDYNTGIGGARSSLFRALATNTSLRLLKMPSNFLRDTDVPTLAQALCENDTLRELVLQKNQLTDQGIQCFAERLPEMKGLEHVWLAGNPFGEVGAAKVLQGLEDNVQLEGLDLWYGFESSKVIGHYINLNRGGRRLLTASNVPLSLWPLVLDGARRKSATPEDVVYCLLHGPAMFER
jgi:hypothetical protein